MARLARNISALVFLVAVWPQSLPKADALSSRQVCVEAPQPRCGSYATLPCEEWPQGGCYLVSQQNEVDQEEANDLCQTLVNTSQCTWQVEAVPDGECYWFCQFEMPRPAAAGGERPKQDAVCQAGAA